MVLVLVRRSAKAIPDEKLKGFVEALPYLIAKAFNIRGGDAINPNEVEVQTTNRSSLDFCITPSKRSWDISITVLADDADDHLNHLEEYQRQLRIQVQSMLPQGISGYVRICLCFYVGSSF